MAWWDYNDPGKRNRTLANISHAMKRRAELSRCPACRRGNALGRAIRWPGGSVRVCRYCGYEKGCIY